MISLTSARELAATTLQEAQARYKHQHDKNAKRTNLRLGGWILVRFPQEETGRWRKLSRPWHGPYRVIELSDPDVTCVKVYYPQEGKLCVHQSRVCVCPEGFPAGFYWYGGGRRGPGRPPKWVDKLLQTGASQNSLVLTQPEHELSSTRDGPENEGSAVESPTVSVQDQMGVVVDEDTTPAQHTGDEVDEARDDNENAHLPMDNVTMGPRSRRRLRTVVRPPDRLM